MLAAEQSLSDTKDKLRDAKRRSRLAESAADQQEMQKEIKELERQQRRQRQQIFDVEDKIEAKRDQLIAALEKRMKQKTIIHPLFKEGLNKSQLSPSSFKWPVSALHNGSIAGY